MERQGIPNQLAIIEIKPKDKYQEENKDLTKITPDESDLIEITPDESDLIEITPDESDLMEITPDESDLIEIIPDESDLLEITPDESDLMEESHEHDEDEMNIKPDFQVHVAVNENDNIIEIKPDINNHEQRPVEVQECMETNHQQVEVKTEYEFITVNVGEALKKDQVNNGNIMEHNNEVSYQVCNISRCLKMFVHSSSYDSTYFCSYIYILLD